MGVLSDQYLYKLSGGRGTKDIASTDGEITGNFICFIPTDATTAVSVWEEDGVSALADRGLSGKTLDDNQPRFPAKTLTKITLSAGSGILYLK